MKPPDTKSTALRMGRPSATRTRKYVGFVICAAVIGAAISLAAIQPWASNPIRPTHSVPYLGVYEPDSPSGYTEVNQFAQSIGRQPNLVSYYSHWGEPFQAEFAASAAQHGAIPLVQLDPTTVSIASIAAGQSDSYLRSFATSFKAFRSKVVLSFCHEMNGNWYPWGYQYTPAKVFVAAWQHVVDVFRAAGATNVIWLWTVNVIDANPPIPNPTPWWPGNSYVNWVGIDGYYYNPAQTFAELFGPTIVDVRAVTHAPILIAETGASRTAGQAAKITDLFAGIQSYGLLGFVWFDAVDKAQSLNWRLNSPAALHTFRQDAQAYMTR
jgi:mannan endo-1,4-beta-mannosidase